MVQKKRNAPLDQNTDTVPGYRLNIIYSGPGQPPARGPDPAREATLSGPRHPEKYILPMTSVRFTNIPMLKFTKIHFHFKKNFRLRRQREYYFITFLNISNK